MARILVIDDEADVGRVVRRYLEMAGHEVVEAGDGRADVKRYQENPADLVITDLFMPEQEGLERIQLGGLFDFRAHAVLMGAQRTLTKPFTREELLNAVGDILAIEPGAARDRRSES